MADNKKKGAKEVTVSGFVEEIELEDGEIGIQINDGDDVYIVAMDKQGKKLLDYVDEEVDATGLVTKNRGQRHITITQFRLLDDFNDDDEDEEDDDLFYDDEK